MAYTKIKNWLEEEISNIHKSGLYKKENILTSSQSTNVDTTDGEKINFWGELFYKITLFT